MILQGDFLAGPPYFQYQNEKRVAANQSNLFSRNFNTPRWLNKMFHLGAENREEQLKTPCID